MSVSAGESQFWEVAAPLQSSPAVARSTVMGLPCLRVNGQFVASFDRRTGDLVVKLAEERVHELIERGQAHPSVRADLSNGAHFLARPSHSLAARRCSGTPRDHLLREKRANVRCGDG